VIIFSGVQVTILKKELQVNFFFFSSLSNKIFSKNHLAIRLLNANVFPCFCIIAHHGSQRTVQLKVERYTGKKELRNKIIRQWYFNLDPDEFLAGVINAVQQADQTLQYNR
jgi:hypothetical protein